MWTKKHNYDLSGQNTFGMKVSCACYVEYDSASDIRDIIASEELPRPFFHIGGGSNLLFTRDYEGTVLHSAIRFIRIISDGDMPLVEVGAGVVFDDFCAWAASEGLWGPENLSLIPGEVGAGAVQNIGAYGVEAGDVIKEVRCISLEDGSERTFHNGRTSADVEDECRYGYRDSIFKSPEMKGRQAVTSVVFALSREKRPQLRYGHIKTLFPETGPDSPVQVREAIIGVRREKLPDPAEKGSAGSFFKNPVISEEHFRRIEADVRTREGDERQVPHYVVEGGIKVPAAWLIESCGFKGMCRGNVAVYHKQPLVIVNETGKASPDEVLSLEHDIIAGVEERFGITLSPEVEHL